MERILDIYGHSTSFNRENPRKEDWYGRLLMDENNDFEGIIEGEVLDDLCLIFGQITDSSIVVTKCLGQGIEEAYKYEGLKEQKKYIGTVQSKKINAEVPMGNCQISLIPADLTREESDYERDSIRKKIQRVKRSLGELGSTLYQRFESSKTQRKEKVRKNTKK